MVVPGVPSSGNTPAAPAASLSMMFLLALLLLLTLLLPIVLLPLASFRVLAVAQSFAVAGVPALDGFPTVVDVLSSTGVSIGSAVPDV